jgi:hypothetical protein
MLLRALQDCYVGDVYRHGPCPEFPTGEEFEAPDWTKLEGQNHLQPVDENAPPPVVKDLPIFPSIVPQPQLGPYERALEASRKAQEAKRQREMQQQATVTARALHPSTVLPPVALEKTEVTGDPAATKGPAKVPTGDRKIID